MDEKDKRIEELTNLSLEQSLLIAKMANKISTPEPKTSILKKIVKGAVVVISVSAVVGLAISTGRYMKENDIGLDNL